MADTTTMENKLSLAIHTAAKAHAGQLYGDGPYIFHPLRVMMMGTDEAEMIVGVLHDTVEDTDVTVPQLNLMFGSYISEAVDAISKREGELYNEFIRRCVHNPLARRVKIYDVTENLSNLTPEKASLGRRYARALTVLYNGQMVGSLQTDEG